MKIARKLLIDEISGSEEKFKEVVIEMLKTDPLELAESYIGEEIRWSARLTGDGEKFKTDLTTAVSGEIDDGVPKVYP